MNKKFFGAVLCILIILLAAIPTDASQRDDDNSAELVKDAAKYAVQELLPLEGTTGISYTDEEPFKVIVYIESEEYRSCVPDEIKGFKTKAVVTGIVRADYGNHENIVVPQLMNMQRADRQGKVRPLIGGVSCGAFAWFGANTGTLGIVTTNNDGYVVILSNAHVIAMNSFFLPLRRGTPVIQPGVYDGGTRNDIVGSLFKSTTIRVGLRGLVFPNHVDGAIAWGVTTDFQLNMVLGSDDIPIHIDMYNPITVSKGDVVSKCGRTTGVTKNTVYDTHAWFSILYGFRLAFFSEVIVVNNPFGEGGDSGSIVYKDGRFVGLHFAGSPEFSYECKAEYVISELGL